MSQSEKRALFISAPPMGWNSYDYYNTEVSEDRVRANAEYMAAHLKEYMQPYTEK